MLAARGRLAQPLLTSTATTATRTTQGGLHTAVAATRVASQGSSTQGALGGVCTRTLTSGCVAVGGSTLRRTQALATATKLATPAGVVRAASTVSQATTTATVARVSGLTLAGASGSRAAAAGGVVAAGLGVTLASGVARSSGVVARAFSTTTRGLRSAGTKFESKFEPAENVKWGPGESAPDSAAGWSKARSVGETSAGTGSTTAATNSSTASTSSTTATARSGGVKPGTVGHGDASVTKHHPTSNSGGGSGGSSKSGRRWPMVLGGAVLVGGLGATAYVNADADRKMRFDRTVTFWSRAFPIFLHYRWVEFRMRNATDDVSTPAFQALHDKYVDRVMDLLLELRGVYIKFGQVGSTRKDFMPQTYIDRLSELQDKVPAKSGEYVRDLVEEGLGKPIDELFEWFDEKPLGAASIGQAHRARLHDGTEVVVKIQYPEVKELFALDLATVRFFCRIAQPEFNEMMDELEKQFMTEFDFIREAWALQTIGDNVRNNYPLVRIPRPIEGMVAEQVFVMEYLPGVKIYDGMMKRYEKYAEAMGKSLEELKEEAMSRKIDSYHRPSAKAVGIYNTLNNIRAQLWNGFAILYNYTGGWITGPIDYAKVEVFNHIAALEEILDVHAQQVLVDGIFNGDPHPGNILLLEDGTVGLIDYGQVKLITKKERLMLCSLVIAMADNDHKATVDLFKSMGFKTKHMNDFVIEHTALLFFDRDGTDVTGDRNLQLFMEHLSKTDPTTEWPQEYLMASRVTFLMRGLGLLLNAPVSVAQAWRETAVRVLEEEGGPNPRVVRPDPQLPPYIACRYTADGRLKETLASERKKKGETALVRARKYDEKRGKTSEDGGIVATPAPATA